MLQEEQEPHKLSSLKSLKIQNRYRVFLLLTKSYVTLFVGEIVSESVSDTP